VTTPSYLMSRGMLLYRDIKFIHTPGMMALLAGLFKVMPTGELAIGIFTLVVPAIAHATVLHATRTYRPLHRAIASVFFLAFFYGWGGNAVWPTPMIAAMALPLVLSLEREDYVKAGIWLGAMIFCKQTAAYALVIALGVLLVRRAWRGAAIVATFASIPYVGGLLLFALAGAAADYVRWTILVPFSILHGIAAIPPLFSIETFPVWQAFAPVLALAAFTRAIPGKVTWLLSMGLALALIAVPRFDYLQLVGAVPCCALCAGRLLEALHTRSMNRGPGAAQDSAPRSSPIHRPALAALAYRPALGVLVVLTLTMGIRAAASWEWDSKITYWNENAPFNALVTYVRSLPPGPVVDGIWPNLLPRTGRLPAGGVYAMPGLWAYPALTSPLEPVIAAAARRKGCVSVVLLGADPCHGARFGPYCVQPGYVKPRSVAI
jgi:hypothetical protein